MKLPEPVKRELQRIPLGAITIRDASGDVHLLAKLPGDEIEQLARYLGRLADRDDELAFFCHEVARVHSVSHKHSSHDLTLIALALLSPTPWPANDLT